MSCLMLHELLYRYRDSRSPSLHANFTSPHISRQWAVRLKGSSKVRERTLTVERLAGPHSVVPTDESELSVSSPVIREPGQAHIGETRAGGLGQLTRHHETVI